MTRFADGKGTYFPNGINTDRLSLGGVNIKEIASVELNIIADGAIAQGDLVYPSGYDATSGKLKMKKADADAAAPANVAWFVAPAAILTTAAGTVQSEYVLTGQNTNSASAVGDPVYLSTTAGEWTLTAPTGTNDTVQQVGVVTVKSATIGQVWLFPSNSVAATADIAAGSITATHLATDSVITVKILDANVTADKLASDSVITAKILDANVTTGKLSATATPNAKAIVAAHEAAIPVTGNGELALTIADATETNTLAVPTFAGQEITISCDTRAGTGTRTITVASAVNITGNNTILLDAAGEYIVLRGIKSDTTFAWRVVASDGATLTTVA